LTKSETHSRRGRWLRLVASLVLGGGLLVLVFHDIDLGEFSDSIRGVHWGWWLVSLVSIVGVHLGRAWRWGRIVHHVEPVAFRDVLSANSVGYLAILVLPFRLGEFVRPYLLHERAAVPFGTVVYSVVVERTLDILALGVMFAIVVLFAEFPLEAISIGDWELHFVDEGRKVLAIALVPFCGCLLFFIVLQDRAVSWTTAAVGLVHQGLAQKIKAMLQSFLEGVRSMKQPRLGLEMGVYTTFIWVLNVVSMWSLCVAFHFEGLGIMAGLVLMMVLIVGSLLPAPPLFAGVFEVFAVAGLALMGIGKDAAAAYAVVCHTIQIVVFFGFGLTFLWIDRDALLRIAALLRRAKNTRDTGEDPGEQ